ncbi:MAG TPA: glycosyltransferase family 2 protein, partial [Dongiaceae bacterium]|nr:glycosyltransferase family 2 protein [Dongiaceae bacterium]
DNGSVDNSLEILSILEVQDEKITILKNPKNLGFAGGVNTGIRYAIDNNYDAVALFNNDAVADKHWLTQLVNRLNNDISIVTGLLLHRSGQTIDSTGDYYTSWGIAFPRSRGMSSKNIPESGFVFGSSGGGSLYKTDLFKEIGLFDETFFAYYEDADISFRTQLAGHEVYYTKDAVAYHKQGATSNKIPGFTIYQTFKNLPLLFWKNVPTKLLFKVGFRFLLLYLLIFANAIKKRSGWPALKGVFASIGYFWTSAIWKRFKIQHNKKVSADYIWSILYHDLPPEQTGMRKFRKLFTGKD